MIKIIDEGDIEITQEQHDIYLDEYRSCMAFYAGPFISFEAWLRKKLLNKGYENVK